MENLPSRKQRKSSSREKKKLRQKRKAQEKKATRRKRSISQSDKFGDDWQELYFVHKSSSSSAENYRHRSEERAMGNEAGTLHAEEALSRNAGKSVWRRRFVPKLSFWCPKLMAHSRSYQVGT
jgi:hypothetical protein